MKVDLKANEVAYLIRERAIALAGGDLNSGECRELVAGLLECILAYVAISTGWPADKGLPCYADKASGITLVRLTPEAQKQFLVSLKLTDMR